LLEAKYEVAGLEGPSVYPSAVVIAEALLIDWRAGESNVSSFIQQILGICQCCLCIFFDIGDHTRRGVTYVRRKHCFCYEKQEERRVAGRRVGCCS
jgi:hypothetical protein